MFTVFHKFSYCYAAGVQFELIRTEEVCPLSGRKLTNVAVSVYL